MKEGCLMQKREFSEFHFYPTGRANESLSGYLQKVEQDGWAVMSITPLPYEGSTLVQCYMIFVYRYLNNEKEKL